MSKKKKSAIEIARRFQRETQKIVDDSKNINEISVQFGDKPKIILAKKKEKK